jgi:hypothetical protein
MARCGVLAVLLLAAPGLGQEPAPSSAGPPALVNSGAPMRVPLNCPPEDLETLGLACPEEAPCPAFLELTSAEGVGSRLFLAGNIHTGAVTLYSILLASSDAGKTWTEAHARILNGSLDQIQFLDYLNGWIGGQLVQPMPHDPFLLKTTDGGATWRRYPIFSERRTGLIESFRFTSPSQGTLWIDRVSGAEAGARYELYESVTGGESWMLRQAVPRRPAATPPSAAGEPLWRLRVSGSPQVYLLEKNESGSWRAIASFLIPLGPCKVPAPAVRPEPPPELDFPETEAPKPSPAKSRRR